MVAARGGEGTTHTYGSEVEKIDAVVVGKRVPVGVEETRDFSTSTSRGNEIKQCLWMPVQVDEMKYSKRKWRMKVLFGGVVNHLPYTKCLTGRPVTVNTTGCV